MADYFCLICYYIVHRVTFYMCFLSRQMRMTMMSREMLMRMFQGWRWCCTRTRSTTLQQKKCMGQRWRLLSRKRTHNPSQVSWTQSKVKRDITMIKCDSDLNLWFKSEVSSLFRAHHQTCQNQTVHPDGAGTASYSLWNGVSTKHNSSSFTTTSAKLP